MLSNLCKRDKKYADVPHYIQTYTLRSLFHRNFCLHKTSKFLKKKKGQCLNTTVGSHIHVATNKIVALPERASCHSLENNMSHPSNDNLEVFLWTQIL